MMIYSTGVKLLEDGVQYAKTDLNWSLSAALKASCNVQLLTTEAGVLDWMGRMGLASWTTAQSLRGTGRRQ